MDLEVVRESRDRGLAFIHSQQASDGSFPLERCSAEGWVSEHRLFSTSTVLLAIGAYLDEAARAAAVTFIKTQRAPAGYWHFDGLKQLPADADDCACAIACLALFD